jgi:sirohydrochlorin cobaltochelatase
MTQTALILFAHGARFPEWASTLNRVCDAVRTQMSGSRVEPAFLEFMAPTLKECATKLVAEGFQRLVVVPMFLAQGGHLKEDLPKLLDELRHEYPRITFELSGPIGEAESVVQAMAQHVLTLAG